MRRVYEDRTCITVKDLKDQPLGKLIAFVEDTFGDKSAISCDGVLINTTAVSLVRVSVFELGSDGKPLAQQICTFSPALKWGILDRSLLEVMDGREWELARAADGKSHEKLAKDIYGPEGIARLLVLPDGRQVPVPVDAEEAQKLKEQGESVEAKPEPQLGQYL